MNKSLTLANYLREYMKRGVQFFAFSLACLLSASAVAQSGALREVSLPEAIKAALKNDPQFQAALAAREVGAEKEVIARGGLLPTISAAITNYPNSVTESRIPNAAIASQREWAENRYSLATKSITLRQPVIRLRNWAAYLQGKTQAEQASEKLRFDRYEAITRIVEIYANWLTAEKRIASEAAKNTFFTERLKQIQELRLRGQATITDELQAQAELRRSTFELAEARRDLAFLNERFTQIVGAATRPKPFDEELSENLLKSIDSLEALKAKALQKNPEIHALRLSAESARWDIKKFQADHIPVLDFVANYAEENNATAVFLGRETRTTTFGFQLTIPIYQGGVVDASTRQAVAEWRRLQAEVTNAEQRVNNDLARLYASLESAVKLSEFARGQAKFADENLLSTVRQQQLGFKTSIDTLKAQETTTTGEYDRARALSLWTISKIELLALTGDLDYIEENQGQLLK
jgi:protease secretion system outer membrane protein